MFNKYDPWLGDAVRGVQIILF